MAGGKICRKEKQDVSYSIIEETEGRKKRKKMEYLWLSPIHPEFIEGNIVPIQETYLEKNSFRRVNLKFVTGKKKEKI